MERWSGAFKLIRRRSFADISAVSPSVIVYQFGSSGFPLKDFVKATWSEDDEPNLVLDFPSRGIEYVNAFCAGYSKFRHVLDCSRNSHKRGAQTWGLIESYHSTVMGARTIAAALGICIFTIKGRTVLVDLFPESGNKDQRRAFEKEHGRKSNPIRVLAPTKDKLLEQSKIWQLVERLFNLKSFASSAEEALQTKLVDSLKSKPWSDRHDIFYDLISWRWPDDINLRPLSSSALSTLLLSSDQEVIEFNQFVDQIFELNEHYAHGLQKYLVGQSIPLPPSSAGMAAPGVVI